MRRGRTHAMPDRRRLQTAAAFVVLLGAGCGDVPTAPRAGYIKVSVETSGGDPNDDHYELVVGSHVRGFIATSGPALFTAIQPGSYSVALQMVSENCTVSGTHPRSVTVPAGKTVEVAFVVACVTTGVEITTRTAGSENAAAFQVLVNDHSRGPVAANGSLVVSRLKPGTYTVGLSFPGDFCSVAGGTQKTVEVSNRAVTPILFEIACVPPLRSQKIAYVVDTITRGSGVSRIALMNPDGSGAVDLEFGRAPSWSPDGTRLVFSTTECGYYYGCSGGLVVVDPETHNVSTPSNGNGGSSPAWSPTGDVIAFTISSRLYLIRLDGSSAAQVVISGVSLVSDPAWSPDGRRIALTCVVVLLNYDVCAINRDGTGFVRLTSDEANETGPAWSPDGSRIAFTMQAPRAGIALMAADGSAVTRLTDGFDAAWSRDGAKLVFTRGDGLFTIDVDGSNLRRLTMGNHYAPVWRP